MPVIPGDDFNAQLVDMVRWWKIHKDDPPPPRPHRDFSSPPPIRGILLEDLVSEGQADCAVTMKDTTTFLQEVSIIGGISGGTFTLTFHQTASDNTGQTTAALPFNATAAQVQTALQNLPAIGKGNVVVQLGKMTFTDADGNGDPVTGLSTASPAVWVVEFVGKFALLPNAPQLLTTSNALTGPGGGLNAALVVAKTVWVDSGVIASVNALVPVGTPTPMRTGAVVIAIFLPGVGRAVVACECREFSQTYY